MKKFIQWLFKNEIDALVKDRLKEEQLIRETERRNTTLASYCLGRKVIIRSNEPDPLFIGEIIGHIELHGNIHCEVSDGVRTIISHVDPCWWSEEREAALRKLNWAEQWNVMNKYNTITDSDKTRKESPEYLEKTRG